jgi:Uma2 family endonuclease
MALAEHELKPPKVLTYEEYLVEEEISERYEIDDGLRDIMTSPTPEHQITEGNISRAFEDYQDRSSAGLAFRSPRDVVVSKYPLIVREPDVLFVSIERWGGRALSDPSPMQNAPELVVEVLSPNETRRQMDRKVGQYASAGVVECWLVSPEASTVEQLSLSSLEVNRVGLYGPGELVHSIAFPGLSVEVARIFKLPHVPKVKE